MTLALPNCKMTFVCGPVASGKTFLIKQWLAADNRHVSFDSTGETGVEGSEEIWGNPRALYDRITKNPYYYRLVYVPGLDRREDFRHVLNVLWWKETPKLLVCDEVADLCPVEYDSPEMEMLLRFGRKVNCGFLSASQRIADVSKLLTSGCRMVVLYQTNEARDLDAIQSRWKCADMVVNLRPLIYDDDTKITQQIPQCVVIQKGKKPYVYDFESGASLESVPRQGDETQPSGALGDDEEGDRGSADKTPSDDSAAIEETPGDI